MPDYPTIPALVDNPTQIPNYRAARSKRPSVLALLPPVCVARLCGARSQAAIAN